MKRESYLVKTRSVCAGKVFEFTLYVGVEYIYINGAESLETSP